VYFTEKSIQYSAFNRRQWVRNSKVSG